MSAKRTYLFLNSDEKGKGKMYTINPKGLLILLVFLLLGSSVGFWALVTGKITNEKWKFRLANVSEEQKQLLQQLTLVSQKNAEIKKEIEAVFETLPKHLLHEEPTTKVDSLVLDTLKKYTLKEMVARSHFDAVGLHAIVTEAKEDSSYWYHLPLGLPIALTSTWFFKNEFGMIPDPISGVTKMHKGIDLAAERGEAVVATGSGRVKKVEKDTFWGKKITLTHKFGYSTIYAHLGSTSVKRGAYVHRGDTLGVVGETGWTTSPLVHYEIKKDGESFDPTIILWYLNRS